MQSEESSKVIVPVETSSLFSRDDLIRGKDPNGAAVSLPPTSESDDLLNFDSFRHA